LGTTDSRALVWGAAGCAQSAWSQSARDTGKIEWDDKLPSSPYGAAAVTGNVVFTTTYHGYVYAFNAAARAILLKTPLYAGTSAPVTIDGDSPPCDGGQVGIDTSGTSSDIDPHHVVLIHGIPGHMTAATRAQRAFRDMDRIPLCRAK
jgi:hypothetical protein